MKRVFLIVLDSFGIGNAPDAADYGDKGANTLASCAKENLNIPNMVNLGLADIDGVSALAKPNKTTGAFARMTEASKGKDTTIGHWEIAGAVSPRPMPVFPNGFPQEFIERFEKAIGRKTLCNKPYSGTDVIRDFGEEHLKTGALIVYTSADSVFQIAAHEEKVPLEELYSICETAREMLTGDLAVGRVIARPFIGEHPFTRTTNRHDFSLLPPKATMLDMINAAGMDVIAVGKISDIFAGSGVTEKIVTKGNTDGLDKSEALLYADFNGLCFINLVDFDMLYGHRNNAEGYARALEEFDRWLGATLPKLGDEDMLMITADHGCDPGTAGTDHTRECTPLLIAGGKIKNVNVGTRSTFADIAATVLEALGLENKTDGKSFFSEIAE